MVNFKKVSKVRNMQEAQELMDKDKWGKFLFKNPQVKKYLEASGKDSKYHRDLFNERVSNVKSSRIDKFFLVLGCLIF